MKKLIPFACLISTTLFAGTPMRLNESRQWQISNFQIDPTFKKNVNDAIQLYGAKNVLLVLDDDNTLLSSQKTDCPTPTNANYNSKKCVYINATAWASWQSKQIQNGGHYAIAKTPSKFYEDQKAMWAKQHLYVTEPDLNTFINKIIKRGVSAIVETARSPDDYAVTQKQLQYNGFDFSYNNTLNGNITPGGNGSNQPFTWNSGNMTCPYNIAGQTHFRSATYQNGIYLLAGQNKGVMLGCLLNYYHVHPKIILFADDTQKNDDTVFKQFTQVQPIPVQTFTDNSELPYVQEFNDPSAQRKYNLKGISMQRWQQFEKTGKLPNGYTS